MDPDLNLLIVFDAVMTERNLRKAGERLGRSQPSVSQSMARLRDLERVQEKWKSVFRPERALAVISNVTSLAAEEVLQTR